jgi:WD40 repeat protein/nucleoside phosphorylase
MASLTAYFVSKSLERLTPDLTPGFQKLAKELVELLDREGRARVADIHQRLFSANTPQSANAALSRLINTINRAAVSRKVPLRAMVTADKKGGASKRWVWFEGSASAGVSPVMSELNAIPRDRLVENQRGMPLDTAPVVVLITANGQESRAVLEHFHPAGPPPVRTVDGMTYNELGLHGGMRVVHRVCKQGQAEAQSAAQDAVQAFQPRAIIAVGIAFGVNPSAQHIGDVLVSEFVRGYELRRVGPNGTISPRGGKQQASSCLYQRFLLLNQRQEADPGASLRWPELSFGTLLSGDKLVDDLTYRNSLLELEHEAIGGEMEGVGLCTAADRHKVDWLIVKAICDWADGNKHSATKSVDQALAADNAALVVKRALDLGSLYDDGPGASEQGDRVGDSTAPLVDQAPLWHPSTSQMGFSDLGCIPEARRVHDARGRPTSLHKDHADDLESDRGESVEVLSHIMRWIDEANGPPVFALLGEYGMGKTVTCQRVARALDKRQQVDPTKPIPLYFDLRLVTGLDRRVPTLQETLEECMRRGWEQAGTHFHYSMESVSAWIRHGAVVILDGLDEVLVKLKEADGQIFTNALLKLLVDARAQGPQLQGPALKVLISCRTHYFRTLRDQKNHFTGQERGQHDLESFRALVLLPFSEAQILNYLNQAVPDIESERLIDIVRSVHNLEELTQRPYTLRLVAEFIPEIEQDRLAGRVVYGVTLYRRMARRWLERDSGKHHILPDHKMRLATHLAAYLWRSGHGVLPANELEAWFHEWLEGQPDLCRRYASLHPDQLEEDLRTATFLTRQDTGAGSAFRFAHTSLLEFFLADFLLAAVRSNRPDAWGMRLPSAEVMAFLGQMLMEADDPALLRTLERWGEVSRPFTSELLLAYALFARDGGWPAPTLYGIKLTRAQLQDAWVGYRPEPPAITPEMLDLGPADFSGADLRRARFERVRLHGASFLGARLDGATFIDCRLDGSDWSSATMTGTVLRQCTLQETKWSDAVLYRAQLLFCTPRHAIPSRDQGVRHQVDVLRAPDAQRYGGGHPRYLYSQCGCWESFESCAVSPDGRYVAAGGDQGAVWIWDATSGEVMGRLAGITGTVHSCVFSPDSRYLATGGDSEPLRVWDVRTREPLHPALDDYDMVYCCAFTADGQRVASVGRDQVCMWDVPTGRMLHALTSPDHRLRSCAFSPDGRSLVTGGRGGNVRIWDTSNGESPHAAVVGSVDIFACRFSPDGERIIAGGSDGALWLWDLTSGETHRVAQVPRHPGRPERSHGRRARVSQSRRDAIRFCALSADCVFAAFGLEDGRVLVYDVSTGRLVSSLVAFAEGGAFSASGQSIVTAGFRDVQLWSSRDGEACRTMAWYDASVACCAFSADGYRMATGSDNGVTLWDARTGERQDVILDDGQIQSCAFAPDGRSLGAGTLYGTIWIADLEGGEAFELMNDENARVLSCDFSPDGRYLLAGGEDELIRVWDVRQRQLVSAFTNFDSTRCCAFSKDGRYVVAGGEDRGALHMWDVASGELVRVLHEERLGVLAVAFAADDRHVLTVTGTGSVTVWDHETGELVRRWADDRHDVTVCAISSDGQRAAVACMDGRLRVINVATGESRLLLGHESSVSNCAFSPDGQYLLSAATDGTVRLWDASDGTCRRVHVSAATNGHAVWSPRENKIIEVGGEAWRWFIWQTRDDAGDPMCLPLETFGSLPLVRLGGAGLESSD